MMILFPRTLAVVASRVLLVLTVALLASRSYGQSEASADVDRALSEVKPFIGMLSADFGDGEAVRHGSGIVVGYDDAWVYLSTAEHVVWKGESPAKRVTVAMIDPTGVERTVPGTVFAEHEPGELPDRPGLDLGVVQVARNACPISLDSDSLRRLGKADSLATGGTVYSVGFADGENKWNLGTESAYLKAQPGGLFQIRSLTMVEGFSGGPVFNDRFQLVGFVSTDTPPDVIAVGIDKVRETFGKWGVPFKLTPGSGRLILGPKDRAAYPLSDALGTIKLSLPKDVPAVQDYSRSIVSTIRAFAEANPKYESENPNFGKQRGLFYVSYNDASGKRVPSRVEIYSETGYWPSYQTHPALYLATRMVSAEVNVFKHPRDPRLFLPGNEQGDLEFSLGAGALKFSSFERQLQSELNNGRLTYQVNVDEGTLGLETYFLKAPRLGWVNEGAFDSLLDLRGCQLLIVLSVGNLGNVTEQKAAYDAIEAGIGLEEIDVTIGGRTLSLEGSKLKKVAQDAEGRPFRNGQVIYVYDFPATSDEFLAEFHK